MTSQLHTFADGEFTITVETELQPNGEYSAIDAKNYEGDSPMGWGLTELSAIADLFERLPRAESEREERDDRTARFDHAYDLRKHGDRP